MEKQSRNRVGEVVMLMKRNREFALWSGHLRFCFTADRLGFNTVLSHVKDFVSIVNISRAWRSATELRRRMKCEIEFTQL